jgi:hypothetical protein
LFHNSQLIQPSTPLPTQHPTPIQQQNKRTSTISELNCISARPEMINWRLNVAQPAAAVILPADINLRALPVGIDPAIQQPTDETVQFTWIVSKTLGNNEYQ